MGNEQSVLPGIEIEEKAVEVSDFWSQHAACIVNSGKLTNLTVFIGELFVVGPLWKKHTPLEKNSKNLMIYRHPCILKYISSWHKNSKYHLAVEEVTPLSQVLAKQNILQICIGLHSILKAVCFLHEKAYVSHNNICTASIFVAKDGSWRLGGMEYLCKLSDLTVPYLNKTKNNRYNKAIDPNEEKNLQNERKDAVDVFAFGVLVSELLKNQNDDDIPSLVAFRDLCKNNLQNVDAQSRPKLSSLLVHDFFNHEFISTHSFLIELPLKSDEEKENFFSNLIHNLRKFNELTVASQLGSLLLSRLVLLNKTAQNSVLPSIFCPKDDNDNLSIGLFSEKIFKVYIVPKLLEIFCVRDAQIRLLLLSHFPQYIHTFTNEELQQNVLPELLVGIKDTNDHLVAITLKTLADLVPILGAACVIGGKRAKLFNDGRPTGFRKPRRNSKKPDNATTPAVESISTNSLEPIQITNLPERSQPDGEEVESSTDEVEQSADEEVDNWEDWDLNENQQNIVDGDSEMIVEQSAIVPENKMITSKKTLPDINELDIKNQKATNGDEEIDFFQDMEPVIESSSKFAISDRKVTDIDNKLKLVVDDTGADGWVDEEWD